MTRFRQAAGGFATILLLAACSSAVVRAGGSDHAALNQPQKPFQIFGNTYYVGTAGLSSVLVVSDYGYVLIDAGLPESAAQIAANIKTLGFDLTEVKAILITDASAEAAGGAAQLQQLTGAQVYAMRAAEQALLQGGPPKGDPRHGEKSAAFPKLDRVWIVQDDQLLGVGNVRVRIIATPGESPGGASWGWDACDGSKCLNAVFASSLAAPKPPKGAALASFQQTFKRLEAAPCELLIAPHPDDMGGLSRLVQAGGKEEAVKDANACKAYVQQASARLGLAPAAGS